MSRAKWTKARNIKVTRKSDGKEMIFTSILGAAKALDINVGIIRASLEKPFHYTHQADYPRDKFGRIIVGAKYCPFDFEYVYPEPMITLYPDSSELASQNCYSMTQAANFLHIPKQRLYALKEHATIGEPCDKPITDPMTGVVWLVVFNTKEGLSVQGSSNWKKDKVAEV